MAENELESGGASLEPVSTKEAPEEQLSEIAQALSEHSQFIANNFDQIYEEVKLLKDNLEKMEIKLRAETDAKVKAMRELLDARIVQLEARTAEQGRKIAEQQALGKQQASHLDDLQRQVGVLFFRFH